MSTPRPLVSSPVVAAYLGVHDVTLRKWRSEDYGPPSYQLGTAIRYDMAEVKKWVRSRRHQATEPAPETVSANRFYEICGLLAGIARDGENVDDTAIRVQDCDHQIWTTNPNYDDGELFCENCGVTAEIAVALQLTATVLPCEHFLEDAEDWALLGHHVDAHDIGDGSFWSCSTEMPDWNTDHEDLPEAAR